MNHRQRRRRRQSRVRGWILALILFTLAVIYILPNVKARMQYPVKYESEIRAAAGAYDLPPALIAAIAVTESAYRPEARSNMDARGLMQITPTTGEWIAGHLKEKSAFTADALYDPITSLRYACWYVDFLLEQFDGDEACAIAGYHAGQGSVRKWLNDPNYSVDGRTLYAFPDDAPQTRHYVSKVQKAYEYYKKVYK